jgi:hypothetical protein
MEQKAYRNLISIRNEFKTLIETWSNEHGYLKNIQERLRKSLGYKDYRVETAIVYNRALDDINRDSTIKIVMVADNPGKNEQLVENNRYLVGQSGKLAESWLRRELGIDFRSEVAILNKTPIHTAKTSELDTLVESAGMKKSSVESLLCESQAAMADLAWRLFLALWMTGRPQSLQHKKVRETQLWPVLWISGLGELKRGGLFELYRDELAGRMAKVPEEILASVWAFNHFSMNQFAIEVKRKSRAGESIVETLARVGSENRKRIFGI